MEIAARLRPVGDEVERLVTIPGIGRRTAEALIAEIGIDRRRFPTPGHLASWAGRCPGTDERAGKRRSGKTRQGSPRLRSTGIEAARAREPERAAVAVGHTILVIVHRLLSGGDVDRDLGGRSFYERDRHAVERRLVARLEDLGSTVSLNPAA